MPMPVSCTANRTSVSVSVSHPLETRTTTSPVSVNFRALPTKLVRIWRNRPGSPRTRDGTSGAIAAASSRPLARARSASISKVLSTASINSKSRISKISLPASILEKSRMSLMIVRSVSPLARIVSAYSRSSGLRSQSSNKPVIPITPFIGVRIS